MKLTFWIDKGGRRRWRLRAANGEIVAASSEGFSSEIAMLQNIQLTVSGLTENAGQWVPEVRAAAKGGESWK